MIMKAFPDVRRRSKFFLNLDILKKLNGHKNCCENSFRGTMVLKNALQDSFEENQTWKF
jgi:hypothetical protein